jgi:hypothetical protein
MSIEIKSLLFVDRTFTNQKEILTNYTGETSYPFSIGYNDHYVFIDDGKFNQFEMNYDDQCLFLKDNRLSIDILSDE